MGSDPTQSDAVEEMSAPRAKVPLGTRLRPYPADHDIPAQYLTGAKRRWTKKVAARKAQRESA